MTKKTYSLKEFFIIFFNLFLFLSTLCISILGIIGGASQGQVGESLKGFGYFKAYTMDSNIIMGIFALIYFIFYMLKLFKNKDIPHWVDVLYVMGTASVSLTFITVLVFLFPSISISSGFKAATFLYLDDMFFFHFFNPIIAVITFFLQKANKKFTLIDSLIVIIPTVIYSIVYLLCVAAFKVWSDFYGFTFGGKYYLIPFVLIVMYGAIFGISSLLTKLSNRFNKL